MKPIVIYIDKEEEGKITLTKEELEKLLDDAYNAGKKDGSTTINYPYQQQPWWDHATVKTNTHTPVDNIPKITWCCNSTGTIKE